MRHLWTLATYSFIFGNPIFAHFQEQFVQLTLFVLQAHGIPCLPLCSLPRLYSVIVDVVPLCLTMDRAVRSMHYKGCMKAFTTHSI